MSNQPAKGPLGQYLACLEAGELQDDPSQRRVAEILDGLYRTLGSNRKKGLFSFLNGNEQNTAEGIYIWGPVGRGKSMLMDMFFEAVPLEKKRRVHFHQFMQEVHARIHEWRQQSSAGKAKDGNDPIRLLAKKVAGEAQLLCFDEFQVSDVADAMILGRLYENLLMEGVVIVSTSNRPPQDLYKDGLNRGLFLPFIDMIHQKIEVVELTGPVDYRYQRIKGLPVYYSPVNEETTQKLKQAFWALTDRDVGDPATVPSEELELKGRTLYVPKAARGVAVFSFKRLCAGPLSAADYLAIAWRYHTVIVVAVPRMNKEMRNEAKRFVTMIDVFYENNVKFICSAEGQPEELYPGGDGSFEFSRTVSRLHEMQSRDYLATATRFRKQAKIFLENYLRKASISGRS